MKRFLIFCLFFISSLLFAERPVLLVVGTRPEAIKMLPVHAALIERGIPTVLCSTGQHAELLDEVFSLFGVRPDFDFKIMRPNQDLFYVTEAVMKKSKELLLELNPALVVVQGDTTSAMVMAMAAFYLHIPVAHVEAGLRSHNIFRPFPEEMNRKTITLLSTLHFPPTKHAQKVLEKEGVSKEQIFCTGNTVVDALYKILDKIENEEIKPSNELLQVIRHLKEEKKKILLLTAHRRESFDGGLHRIYAGVKAALRDDPTLFVIYPRHPNPKITEALQETKFGLERNLWVTPPLPYNDLLYILNAADGVATDSGGIQEEAVSLNKPTLVLREETDRPEGLIGGLAKLVGTDTQKIAEEIGKIQKANNTDSQRGLSPYGDGHASERIAEKIKEFIESGAS